MIVYCVRRTRLFCTFHNAFVLGTLNTSAAQKSYKNLELFNTYLAYFHTYNYFCLYIPMASCKFYKNKAIMFLLNDKISFN